LFHIFARWILRYGVPLFALNYANRRWGGHMVMDAPWWLWNVGVLSVTCTLFGWTQWRWNEKQLRAESARKLEAPDKSEERIPS
jgi:hypothetical protein